MLYHTRLISINIPNLVISLDYIKAHVNLTKIDLMSFLEIYKRNKIRERWSHNDFYTSSLNIWATSSLLGQSELDHALYQKNYKIHQRLHFWI